MNPRPSFILTATKEGQIPKRFVCKDRLSMLRMKIELKEQGYKKLDTYRLRREL